MSVGTEDTSDHTIVDKKVSKIQNHDTRKPLVLSEKNTKQTHHMYCDFKSNFLFYTFRGAGVQLVNPRHASTLFMLYTFTDRSADLNTTIFNDRGKQIFTAKTTPSLPPP